MMWKYKIERFEKPIKKEYQDVKKYDVARFEYGDYDNWVDAIILNITPENERILKIEFAMIDGRVMDAYEFVHNNKSVFEIIGTATEIKKEQDNQR